MVDSSNLPFLDPPFNQLEGKHRLTLPMCTYAINLFYAYKAVKLIGRKQLFFEVCLFP